jgi:hypothetical protein
MCIPPRVLARRVQLVCELASGCKALTQQSAHLIEPDYFVAAFVTDRCQTSQ